jgi:hypothetical protein
MKWAFWGLVVSNVCSSIINLWMGTRPTVVLLGLVVAPLVLWAAFQVGIEEKGWPQLK